jgi:hypothetical protein
MRAAAINLLLGSLLLLGSTTALEAKSLARQVLKPASSEVNFRNDDLRAQRLAKKLLDKEFGKDEDMPPESELLRTAWVNVSRVRASDLFVMYGCSSTGNCGLYGFEPTKSGWRLVLDSLAQTCSVLPSSHGGRRDLSAYMHGDAIEGALKTYWWRKNRYVRVSERDLISK